MSEQNVDEQSQKYRRDAEARFRRVLQFDQKPQEIAAELRSRVIGQDAACQAFSVRLRQHLLQAREMFTQRHLEHKSWRPKDLGGVLVLGPTGCGKTHLMRTLTDLSSLIFHLEDTTGLSETAYVGRDTSDIARVVVQNAYAFQPLAETALVFLDEADKLRFRPDNAGKDVTGEGVQRSLLAFLDGMDVYFGTDDRRARNYSLRTDALFMVLGGAFAGLDQVIARRTRHGKSRIGFGRELSPADQACQQADLMEEVIADDLILYGFMPELVGRLRDFVIIHPLSASALQGILLQPDYGPLAAYQKMAAAESFSFELTEELAGAVVAHAMASGQGARVLRRVMAKVTRRALFEVPSLSHKRGTPVVRLGAEALQDGSYEVVCGAARRPLPSPMGALAEIALQAWLDREVAHEAVASDAGPVTAPRQMEPEPVVPEALEQYAEQFAAVIAEQIQTAGHEVEVEVDVRMRGRDVGVYGEGNSTPVARVTLWVRSPNPKLPPPELHGGSLRAYVRRAKIETTHWRLLNGARAYGTKLRADKRRWRRHVVYLGLDRAVVDQFLCSEDHGDQK